MTFPTYSLIAFIVVGFVLSGCSSKPKIGSVEYAYADGIAGVTYPPSSHDELIGMSSLIYKKKAKNAVVADPELSKCMIKIAPRFYEESREALSYEAIKKQYSDIFVERFDKDELKEIKGYMESDFFKKVATNPEKAKVLDGNERLQDFLQSTDEFQMAGAFVASPTGIKLLQQMGGIKKEFNKRLGQFIDDSMPGMMKEVTVDMVNDCFSEKR